MSSNLDYPFLLAVHMLCIDGQLHQNELKFLRSLAQSLHISPETQAATDAILSQSDDHLKLQHVIDQIQRDQRVRALSLAALATHYDGTVDRTELKLLERIKQLWHMDTDAFTQIQTLVEKEAARLYAEQYGSSNKKASTTAKILSGIEAVVGRGLVDRVVDALGAITLKEKLQDYRIEALLSGPEYEKAIEACRQVGLHDIEIADACLRKAGEALSSIIGDIDSKISQIESRIGGKPAQTAREALKLLKEDRSEIDRLVRDELLELQELQVKKRRAMNFYSIAFMGRSKAGKSTLHAVVTGGGWDEIGVGRQNTTRLNRVYEWNNIRIIDTPGIATPGGEELQSVAESIIDEADLICFVVTDNNQQTSEFEFLKQLRTKGKPLLVLLNVKTDLSNPVRLKRFLAEPDLPFSDEKDRLGGHIDRIRRDALEHYGTSNFPIVPVQLLAAQIAQQNPEGEHATALLKASRLQHFLDSVRLSLLDQGLLRRSQNLLGSTVSDIQAPCTRLRARADVYLKLSNDLKKKASESTKRLKTSKNDHVKQLEQSIRCVFAELRRIVPDFAEDHWDSKQDSLNSAWSACIKRFGMQSRLQSAQEKSMQDYSSDMTDLLDEIGRELTLNRRLSFNMGGLSEQESSAWAQQTSKWGGGILGTIGSILLALPAPEPWHKLVGGILVGVGVVLGVLASIFESKASKRRKAAANISTSLNAQIDEQEEQIVKSALSQFKDVCSEGRTIVQGYFEQSSESLRVIGEALSTGADTLQQQSNLLNIHFAARILDFASAEPSESSAEAYRQKIHEVRRTIGSLIDIVAAPSVHHPKNLNLIEQIIQEKVTLNVSGAKA